MTSPITRATGALFMALAVPVTGANAQVSTNRVAANTDWSVFVEESPKECWGVTAPKETVNTKDGKPVSVRRGDILLFVTYRPGSAEGEVSFTGGYKFRSGSTVKMEVGDESFDLFTVEKDDPDTSGIPEDELAWASSSADDAAINSAMRKGTVAVVVGVSSRGTQTRDTFSLLGVSAALDEAAKRCAG